MSVKSLFAMLVKLACLVEGAWRGGSVDVSYEQISPQKLAHTHHGSPSRFMEGCFPCMTFLNVTAAYEPHCVQPRPQPITYNTVHITLCGQSDVNGCMQFNRQPVLCLLKYHQKYKLIWENFQIWTTDHDSTAISGHDSLAE